jgi:hypothetical protein
MATNTISPSPQKPRIVEAGFGRFFFAAKSVVYFSPVVRSIADIGRCYQVNDPTSDNTSDVLATDGGEISVDGAGNITELFKFRYGILIFAENGVWYLSGPDGIFSATSYSLSKISDRGCIFPDSVVLAESSVLYFSEEGIIQISENEFNVLVDQDLTQNTIRTHYIDFYSGVDVAGGYKPNTKEVWWWQKSAQSDQPPMRDAGVSTARGLVLDLNAGAFYPQQTDNFETIASPVRKNSDFYHITWRTSETNTNEVTVTYRLKDNISETFSDGSVPPYTAYMETGYETLGKFANNKSTVDASFFFHRTETQILDYDWDTGVYTYDKPSGCYLQMKWDYDNTRYGNKWVGYTPLSPATVIRYYEIYDPNVRGFIPPTLPCDFDDGYNIVSKRMKLRGSGKAVKFRFESKDNEDMQMLGYSVTYSVRSRQ